MKVLSEIPIEIDSKDIDIVRFQGKEILNYKENKDIAVVLCCRDTSKILININLPNLKLVQLTSAGFDGVPIKELREKGINVANAGGTYSIPIAEMIVYGILQVAKRYWKSPKRHYLKPWRHYSEISELAGKKAVILACGNIGTAAAERLKGFDVAVDGYDPYIDSKSPFGRIYRTKEELQCSLSKYDYIISTLPHTKDTDKTLDKEFFASCSKESVFINVGRRGSIDESALYNALKKKNIGYAVLDMFEKVPNPITNPFRRLKNVIVLPGVAAISRESKLRLKQTVADNIINIQKQGKPNNIINK